MDHHADKIDPTPLPLLSLVGHDGESMGTTLLRLAHRAAAQHRLAAATRLQQRAASGEPANETPTLRVDLERGAPR